MVERLSCSAEDASPPARRLRSTTSTTSASWALVIPIATSTRLPLVHRCGVVNEVMDIRRVRTRRDTGVGHERPSTVHVVSVTV